MTSESRSPSLNPQALPVRDAARLLSRLSGQTVSEDELRADLAAGLPANPDGTLNLIWYAAWLVREMNRGR
jgi:hypothetical protein